ncbi:MAG: glycosyltransferase family 39 protein, partial [Chthoniobacteraceae bacterium]
MSQTLNHGDAEGYLPPRGFERVAFLVLAALILALKVVAIDHFRVDSDETQHAHVVWGWVTGQLQYRDVFDNHMPLFQMLCAPVMALFGERADIMILLRWAMFPFFLVSIGCVYRLAELLYSRRAAPWCTLFAATLWKFFYTSTEFRTDQLWTAFWLLSLVVAVSGTFTIKRAFVFGL